MATDSKSFFAFEDLETPPLGETARKQAGFLLRMVQENKDLPPGKFGRMHNIGSRVYELYVDDDDKSCSWRIIYHIADDAIVVLDYFKKKSAKTPDRVIQRCQSRLKKWNDIAQ